MSNGYSSVFLAGREITAAAFSVGVKALGIVLKYTMQYTIHHVTPKLLLQQLGLR